MNGPPARRLMLPDATGHTWEIIQDAELSLDVAGRCECKLHIRCRHARHIFDGGANVAGRGRKQSLSRLCISQDFPTKTYATSALVEGHHVFSMATETRDVMVPQVLAHTRQSMHDLDATLL